MNELTINVADYINEDRMREICEEEFRSAVAWMLRKEGDVQRVLSNISYEYVFDCLVPMVDEVPVKEYLKQKVEEIIRDPNSLRYEVFRDSRYGDKESPARKILNEVLSETRPIIEEEVRKRIAEYDFRELRDDIEDTICNCVIRMIRGEHETD